MSFASRTLLCAAPPLSMGIGSKALLRFSLLFVSQSVSHLAQLCFPNIVPNNEEGLSSDRQEE
jgi:hypothetical protein